MKKRKELKYIASQFQICGELADIERFGSGNINDTYRSVWVHKGLPVSYIHQKISKAVFPHPDHIMENTALVTSHIRQKLRQEYPDGSPHAWKTTLDVILTNEGKLYYVDADGEYWRSTAFIPDAVSYDVVQGSEHAYEAGKILGEFQRFVSDIPPEQLHDTLPGFHHTPIYYDDFLHTLESTHSDPAINARKQEPGVVELINKIRQHESLVSLLLSGYHSGKLRERVVHNDPKINNMLIHTRTQRGICIIDLDTVKGGLIHFDYGDCLRSAANPAGEETQNIRQVGFDLKIFECITKGYLEEARSFLSESDIAYLVDSIKVIAFELGMRFFTDYLKGDVYFKTSYATQNLNRGRVQLALLEDIERKEAEARKIIHTLVH